MLANGVPLRIAARSIDVDPRTVRRWLAEGDLRERVEELRSAHAADSTGAAAAEARMVVLLLRASRFDWRASAWWLERRYPERWAVPRV